ncbi:NADP-dependent oxidoreductase [Actinacidiphila glaucinigra]|uniref:NADPH:quinone reductase n=1 Tax=Actinacidiphila glaucinigra TaxID=235986 RepID=A0A239LX29_9ACTN|nr:NADP-dependent oxidoreductase [Actinacidiphila glaucinigra]SNT34428.1 NADPH:quinone reductase [Actinacidiphila glaucinigra]
MPRAVQYKTYGGTEVLQVVEVGTPEPTEGEVLVKVKAAGINPGESKTRAGTLAQRPLPSGQGIDLAGVVVRTGPGVTGFAAGDEVMGFTWQHASHADYVAVEAANLIAKPARLSWEVAGSLFVVGTSAYAAVRAVAPQPGETVVVSGAAGGVGMLAVQLARRAGADVIGIAGPANHRWLSEHDVTPIAYGEGVRDRLRQVTDRVDAFIDTHGDGYLELAVALGVTPTRINTLVDYSGAARLGAKTEACRAAATSGILTDLAQLAATGALDVPIAATYPLDQVRAAYDELAGPHPRGKIVLLT